MGLRILASVLAVTLLFSPLDCQVPNTDEYFLFELLQKMGLNPGKDPGFTGSFCSWRGVFCDDNARNVVKFDASGLGLSGVIPDDTLGKLVKLESLDLSNNNISALPSDFWSLGSLKNLNVSCNQISGALSSNIGNFGQLQSLDLSFNNLSGSIPEAISSLGSLQVVNLSYNEFQSAIPSGICQCRALVSIDLSENDLNGSLPNGFGGAFPQLMSLNLAGNHILGRDSDFSGIIKSINSLNLSGNSFEGSVVNFFEGPLKVIDLSRNQFQGIIDQLKLSSTFDLSNLLYLDLSENQLSGGFFSSLSHARNLKHVNLAYNRFTEQPFFQVDMLTNLEYLNLSATDLRGEIPGNLSHLTSLRTLDLSRNHLTNQIPPIVFENLQILDLSQNNLTGEVPLVLIQEFHQMKSFNFSYNNLTYCGSQFSTEIPQSAFIGSVNTCPIAANPKYFKRKSSNTGLKLALALTFSMIFLLVGLLFLAFGCRRKTRTSLVKQTSFKEEDEISGPFSFQTDSTIWVADVKQATSVPVVIFDKPLLNFTFADLLTATSNFDRGMLLAEGRFGPVYGGLLPGGIHVAVKVLVKGSTITDHEAARELEYLGRIKHPNLVPLAGYCLAGEQRIAIYDYMDNGNLQNLLYDLPLGVQTTEDWTSETWEDDNNDRIKNVGPQNSLNTWKFRHQIALGTARALAFLHHGCSPPIIHQDVKASNVYLDSNLEPRLSDFGLSKIFINGAEDEVACGSPGYIPPEFLQHEESCSTTKCDVYGFGVVLFQLITGKKPVEDDYPDEREGSLVSWVRGLVKKNQALRGVDPKIRGTAPENQIVEALKIGYLCTAEIPLRRPTMQQVVGLLKDLEQIVV